MASKRKPEDLSKEAVKLRRKVIASMNTHLKDNVKTVSDSWFCDEQLNRGDIHFSSVPFKHCVLKNFIQDEEYLKDLKEELLNIKFVRKQNDLYQFHQSFDLSVIDTPLINSLKAFLAEEVSVWLHKATNIKLNNKISVTCSSYTYTDHLLCHDDKCEDRRIAFILYLNEDWLPDYGGSLELFNANGDNQPNQVVKTISPTFNSFVFFEVMSKSFHQVSEVTVVDRTRLSINGWFHGPLPECREISEGHNRSLQLYSPILLQEDCVPSVLINKMYWNCDVQAQISNAFELNSEILLPDFFNSNFYSELCQCLCNEKLNWEMQGPANKRKYEMLCAEKLPLPLYKVVQLFKSEHFFKLLCNLTKLELSPSQKEKTEEERASTYVLNPQCSYKIQRWQKGFYTLMNDEETSNYAMDVIFYCNVDNLKNLHGGFISYVAHGEDEELLTLMPSYNGLALTYRDKDTLNFVKYISDVFSGCFHLLHFTYYENIPVSDTQHN